MNISFPPSISKPDVLNAVDHFLKSKDLHVIQHDSKRPWGGFFVIDENQSEKFIDLFFEDLDKSALLTGGKLSPKILVVAPGKRLSWQYHNRRAEIWKLIGGDAAVVTSETDVENEKKQLQHAVTINLKQGERHRLVGCDTWGIVAEIWQHTDIKNPSDEDDIIRLQDDFGRSV